MGIANRAIRQLLIQLPDRIDYEFRGAMALVSRGVGNVSKGRDTHPSICGQHQLNRSRCISIASLGQMASFRERLRDFA